MKHVTLLATPAFLTADRTCLESIPERAIVLSSSEKALATTLAGLKAAQRDGERI